MVSIKQVLKHCCSICLDLWVLNAYAGFPLCWISILRWQECSIPVSKPHPTVVVCRYSCSGCWVRCHLCCCWSSAGVQQHRSTQAASPCCSFWRGDVGPLCYCSFVAIHLCITAVEQWGQELARFVVSKSRLWSCNWHHICLMIIPTSLNFLEGADAVVDNSQSWIRPWFFPKCLLSSGFVCQFPLVDEWTSCASLHLHGLQGWVVISLIAHLL